MIYDIWFDSEGECISCVDDEGFEAFRRFQGVSIADSWGTVQVVQAPIAKGGTSLPSDFLWRTSGELIMRRRAVFALRDMLEAGGEILPLTTHDEVSLFALNVTRVLDAMDEENSKVKRFSGSDDIMYVRAHAFRESLVRDVPFFKLPYYGSPIFVGESFRERVREAGLMGLDFVLAWSPGTGAVEKVSVGHGGG